MAQRKKRDEERSPVSDLSDDLLVEIISRLPYKSTRCCKCICRRWRDLISHPDHRRRLPQSTLAGLFYQAYDRNRHPHVYRGYQSITGSWCTRNIDTSLSFLPRCERPDVDLLDSCNGLLLCRCRNLGISYYVVCNPASQKHVLVPATDWSSKAQVVRLGFDPAVSSHFRVFELAHDSIWDGIKGCYSNIKSVGIYSSETGAWTHRSAWDQPIAFYNTSKSAFLDGALYLSSYLDLVIAVVDVDGNCRVIRFPTPHVGNLDVYISRGQLYLAPNGCSELSIWAVEDSSSDNWILKHNVSHLQLFRKEQSLFLHDYCVIIHPEYNVIFIICTKASGSSQSVKKLMSYDLDSGEVHFISDLGVCRGPYLSYVPLFSKSLTDGHEKS